MKKKMKAFPKRSNLYLWDPIFRFGCDSGTIGNTRLGVIEAFFDKVMKSNNISNDFIVEDMNPPNGLFQLIPNEESISISKEVLLKLSIIACEIYNMAEIKIKESPKRSDVYDDLDNIKFHAEHLYRAMFESNYYTKMAFHEDASLSRADENIYNNANGESLPRVFNDRHPGKNGWPESLTSLIDLMDFIREDFNLALNPGNGPLFQKSAGSPDFILAWNAHVIMDLFNIQLTTTPNSMIWEFAQILKEFAVKGTAAINWQGYHFGSIIDWKTSIKETRLCIIALVDAISIGGREEVEMNHLINQLQRMRGRESWLISSPGRNTSDRGLSKGNFPLFSDPTAPIELPDHS